MRNTVWRALALAALIGALPAANAAADWQDYVYAEDGFSIASPTKPEFSSSAVDSAAGKTYLHQYESDADADHTYMVAVSKYPTALDIQSSIEGVKQAQLDSMKGRITGEHPVSLGGVTGTDYDMTSADYLGHIRIYVTSQTLYQIMVLWSINKPPADYGRYINSFHFVTN
ncbi:MAG TPA: hypothetical protein VN795_05770 [Stellaceae bacterium]|nr:hypothetical protein [Stellaceae bacterium]